MWAFVEPDNWNVSGKKKKKDSYIFHSNLNLIRENEMGKKPRKSPKNAQHQTPSPRNQPLQVKLLISRMIHKKDRTIYLITMTILSK